jgi:hypothetical protein
VTLASKSNRAVQESILESQSLQMPIRRVTNGASDATFSVAQTN